MTTAKILWGEGLFLRPQHFQQQDAYHEALARDARLGAQPLAWGVRSLEIDTESFAHGTFRIERIDAVLPDGERYLAPERDLLPPPLALDDARLDRDGCTLHLALPYLSGHGGNAADDAPGAGVRYAIERRERIDLFTAAAPAEISVLRKCARIGTAAEVCDQYLTLPLARVRRAADGSLEADPAFLPPCLMLASSPALRQRLLRLLDILQAKAAALYGFHREPSKNVIEFRSGDIASFWLLHTVSAAYAALRHLHCNPTIHPERLYHEMLRLAGGLMTFSTRHRLEDLPAYEHADAGPAFAALDEILRVLLETVISSRCVSIALHQERPGFHLAHLDAEAFGADTALYLAVSAAHPQAELLEAIPARLKAGTPDDVDKLVLSAMGGIRLTHTPQLPPAVPVRPGNCYFVLEARGPLYERMLKARMLSFYVPNGFQDLKLDLIAVMP